MRRHLLRLLALAGAGLAAMAAAAPEPTDARLSAAPPPVVEVRSDHIVLWPYLAVAMGASAPADFGAARVSREFQAPRSASAALGFHEGPVWLRAEVSVPGREAAQRLLSVDYALLNRIEARVIADGEVVSAATMGNKVPMAERPIAGRGHAAELRFPPGRSTLILRVDSSGSKILPVTLSTWAAYHRHELVESILQGLSASLGVWLLFYSLLQWRVLQERLYLKYSLLIISSTLFSVHFFGIGEQYLWTDHDWIENHLAGLTSLGAACGTALFVEDALRRDSPRAFSLALRALATITAVAGLAHALDVIDIRFVGAIMGTLGLMPGLLGTPGAIRRLMPGAIRRLMRGDVTGGLFLVAWTGYLVGSAIMVGVVKGEVGAGFWTLHSFQLAATFDMLVFMQIAVIGTRRMKAEMAEERRQFLEHQKQELEVKVAERTAELALERQRSDALLLHILPPAIAEELKLTGRCEPKRHEEVTVLFTDLVDFTSTVARIPAAQEVAELNELFTAFDGIVAEFGLEKINTVGDAYMAAAGVPAAVTDHAARTVRAALAMVDYVEHRNRTSAIRWQLRAGVHSGPVVAGVVGSTKYAYGIWGDTVNVASRMESHSEPGRVNISATTRALVKGVFATRYRGKLEAKGKGEIDMYFVVADTAAANDPGPVTDALAP